MAAPRASIAVSVARAGLTLATAFTLTRVFAGRSWLVVMVIAALVPPALLEWAQRRHWHPLVRLGVVAAAGAWMAALLADPGTTVAGIPSRTTIASLGHAISQAPHTLRAAVVPVSPNGAALVLAFVGVYAAAALTHWIATTLEAPVGAFAPSIALFIVVAAIGSGGWVWPTALYAIAALAYLLALAQNDLTTRRTWFHASRPRGSRLAAGGALVGAIAVATALVVGPSVPGAGGSPLLDYRSLGRGSGGGSLLSAPPPILSIRDKLKLGPVQELFTVKAPRAAYWRVIALDWFTNDNAWGVNRATEQAASKLTIPPNLPRSSPLHEQFHIKDLDPHWLPAAYQPVQINLTAARVVPDSLTLLVDSKSELHDLVYDVDSRIPTPSQVDLLQAPFSNPRLLARDLELPSDFPEPVRTLARQITGNADTPYGRAAALEAFFRNGTFHYTVDTDLGDSPEAITRFLTQTRAGFCEQFAASFAALARAAGVPARVAVGYQPGTLADDGLYHVTNRNAHAWPEVWIEGSGWIPFEPTPGFAEPTLGLGTGGPSKVKPSKTPPTTPGGASTSTSRPVLPTVVPKFPGNGVQVQAPATGASSHHTVRNVLRGIGIAVAAVLLGVAGFFAIISFTLWRRGRRRRHDHDPRRRVLGAWAEAVDFLRSAGVPPRPSATALEFALRYAPAHGAGDAGPALMELARLQSAAMFAREEPTEVEASFAWEQVDTIRETMRRNVARTTRFRRRISFRNQSGG
jgi:transglutaminase-like putative cysteine protease